MNVLIVGCGREGSEMARSISQQGHKVTIVAANPMTSIGWARISRTHRAGLQLRPQHPGTGRHRHADAFAATTQSDNENIVAAKIARESSRCPVVARVYNPGRREVYERLGLQTVMSTPGAPAGWNRCAPSGVIDMEQIGHGDVRLLKVRVPAAWHELRSPTCWTAMPSSAPSNGVATPLCPGPGTPAGRRRCVSLHSSRMLPS